MKYFAHIGLALRGVDLLIASRLHGTILGFISEPPTLAIACEPKVNWQTDYLLEFHDFTSKDVIDALDRLDARKDVVMQQITSYRWQVASAIAAQYDTLAGFVTARK
jgi:hypothetical protein